MSEDRERGLLGQVVSNCQCGPGNPARIDLIRTTLCSGETSRWADEGADDWLFRLSCQL